jgi:hypothetical protein
MQLPQRRHPSRDDAGGDVPCDLPLDRTRRSTAIPGTRRQGGAAGSTWA